MNGIFSRTDDRNNNLRQLLFSFTADTNMRKIIHEQAIGHFTKYMENRRFRSATDSKLYGLWYLVVIAAVFNVVLVRLLGWRGTQLPAPRVRAPGKLSLNPAHYWRNANCPQHSGDFNYLQRAVS